MVRIDEWMDILDFSVMTNQVRPAFISPATREGKYLFLDLHPPAGEELVLVGAGRELCTPDYRIDRRGFMYHTVEFVLGGNWEVRHRGRQVPMGPGAVFAYGPETSYSLEAREGPERIKYFMNFTGGAAERWITEARLQHCAVRRVRQTRWIHDLFEQLLDGALLEDPEVREIGTRLMELILWRLRTDAWPMDERRTDGRETFERCRAFIHDHYLEVSSVAEVADGCHVNPAYLARLFKRFGGERPLQMLTRLKTRHAADLILRRGFGVGEAGQVVGFADPYHFSRVFKRVHGVPPGSLRTGRTNGGGSG